MERIARIDWEPRVQVDGTATVVAHLGPDGFWRYVIDNPFGTATAG